MIQFIRLFSISTFVLTSINVFAASQHLVSVTNEEDSELLKLSLVIDGNSDITEFKKSTYSKRKQLIKEEIFKVHNAASGIVIYKKKKREIVKLISKNFSRHQGGNLDMSYLYSGISGSRNVFKLDLRRDGDKWGIFANGRKAQILHFVSNKKAFIGTIGIKKVVIIK
jgi:hypothetical protein